MPFLKIYCIVSFQFYDWDCSYYYKAEKQAKRADSKQLSRVLKNLFVKSEFDNSPPEKHSSTYTVCIYWLVFSKRTASSMTLLSGFLDYDTNARALVDIHAARVAVNSATRNSVAMV